MKRNTSHASNNTQQVRSNGDDPTILVLQPCSMKNKGEFVAEITEVMEELQILPVADWIQPRVEEGGTGRSCSVKLANFSEEFSRRKLRAWREITGAIPRAEIPNRRLIDGRRGDTDRIQQEQRESMKPAGASELPTRLYEGEEGIQRDRTFEPELPDDAKSELPDDAKSQEKQNRAAPIASCRWKPGTF